MPKILSFFMKLFKRRKRGPRRRKRTVGRGGYYCQDTPDSKETKKSGNLKTEVEHQEACRQVDSVVESDHENEAVNAPKEPDIFCDSYIQFMLPVEDE